MGCAGRGQAAGRTAETQSSKSTSSSSASSSPASNITPHRSPGPWFLAGAPSKLSIRPASTLTRPPRCNDFQLFERLKLSAGLGVYPPYCPRRLLCRGVPTSRIAHRGGRAIWRTAKCCAAALFLGAPHRPTPWAVSNSLGLPTGAFWLHTRGQKSFAFNRVSRVFAVFGACAP